MEIERSKQLDVLCTDVREEDVELRFMSIVGSTMFVYSDGVDCNWDGINQYRKATYY